VRVSAEPPPETAAPSPARRRPPARRPLPFDVVVERHGPAVLRLCVARLGPDRGEDCFQETLLSALRGYDGLRDPEAVAGWLFAIARHRIADAARAAGRSPVPAGDALGDALDPWHDPPPASGVWARVAGLPPKQREAVGLRYLADLSHAEIAAAMGTSVEAARRSVFEGLRRLRETEGG
jgi:DNA-directed RNA polymerase specialized sigma24 family protein